MIVDHLCYGVTGGAAIAALRIHDGLRLRGIDSRFWHAPGLSDPGHAATAATPAADHASNDQADPSCHPLSWPTPFHRNALEQWFSKATRTARDLEVKFRHLRFRPDGYEYFSTGRLRYATPWPTDQLQGDVLVLHWIGKLFDYPSFFDTLPQDRPIVWVLHDMNPFTGGCHFSAGCDRFTKHCGHCPQIASSSECDITFQTLRMKRRLYEGLNLHVVAPSEWLIREAKRSIPMSGCRSHQVIPYGLKTDLFAPVDRRQARRALSLDQLDPAVGTQHVDDAQGDDQARKRIVLFGAASNENRRKGFHCLLEAWSKLPADSVQGLMFGEGQAPQLGPGLPEIRHLGFVSDPAMLRLVYAAADLFVLPSLEDNLPQTGLEAMACGTPVVGFATGGIPDYVRPGETGLLAETGDTEALARQILRLVEQPELADQMGRQARTMMVGEFSQPIESERYAELFSSLVATRGIAGRAA